MNSHDDFYKYIIRDDYYREYAHTVVNDKLEEAERKRSSESIIHKSIFVRCIVLTSVSRLYCDLSFTIHGTLDHGGDSAFPELHSATAIQ